MRLQLAVFLILLVIPLLARAQAKAAQDPPVSLDEVIEFVKVPALPTATEQMIDAIKINGLGFEMNESALTHVLRASREGNRTPAVTAKLIVQILQACLDCRGRYFGPLNKADLLTLVANRKKTISQFAIKQEVQLRGVQDLPKTMEFAAELRRAGASAELIDLIVPVDQIPLLTPPGFERNILMHAPAYDRGLPNGTVSLIVRVVGQVEFALHRDVLFTKTLPSGDKKVQSKVDVVMGALTTPIPDDGGRPGFELYDDLGKKKDSSKQPKIESTDDQTGFRFLVNTSDKDQHVYEIRLKYDGVSITPVK